MCCCCLIIYARVYSEVDNFQKQQQLKDNINDAKIKEQSVIIHQLTSRINHLQQQSSSSAFDPEAIVARLYKQHNAATINTTVSSPADTIPFVHNSHYRDRDVTSSSPLYSLHSSQRYTTNENTKGMLFKCDMRITM